LNELAFFAGAGGGILGGTLLGWRTVCAVEIDSYAASVLCQRQNDGILPSFPIWDDVCTFDGEPWRGIVDVVSGGFPCQDISCAGRGAGIDGEQSGLWREMARIIYDIRPRFAFVENSPMLTVRGLGKVLGDLAEMGYDAEWCVLGADDVGAPHIRKRIWILAYTPCERWRRGNHGNAIGDGWSLQVAGSGAGEEQAILANAAEPGWSTQRERVFESKIIAEGSKNISNADSQRFEEQCSAVASEKKYSAFKQCNWWGFEPDVGRVVNGVAARVDRLKAIGNGQVPAVAALAWNILYRRVKEGL